MSPIAFLRQMLASGMELDTAMAAAEAFEQSAAAEHEALINQLLDRLAVDKKAEARRAKDRERKALKRGIPRISADSAEQRKSPEPPKKTTPIPPLKGGTFPVETQPLEKPLAADREKSLSVWVSEIWEITPRPSRERSGRRDLENSLRAAQRRGADLAQIKAGLAGYFGSEDATKAGGQFCKGVHTLISSGRWEAFLTVAGPDPPEPVDPWRQRLLGWEVNGYWNSEWGPKPGKPGCLAPSRTEIAA